MPPRDALLVILGPEDTDPRRPAIVGAARRYVEQIPYLRLAVPPLPDADPQTLERCVDEALSQSPAAVCLWVSDPIQARPLAERIRLHGAVLVTMGAPIDGVIPFAHVAPDLPGGARLLAENLARLANGRRSYILLHEDGASAAARPVYDRFMPAARDQPLTLLEQREVRPDGPTAPQVLREMLGRFRHAGLVVTLLPDPWLTEPASLILDPGRAADGERMPPPGPAGGTPSATGPSRGPRFVTLSAVPPLWRYLRSGEAAALVGPLDGLIGSTAVELAVRGMMRTRSDNAYRLIPCELVTRENLESFARRYAEAGNLELHSVWPP